MNSRLIVFGATFAALAPISPAQAWRGPERPLDREALVAQCAGQIGHSTMLVTVPGAGFSNQLDITRLNVAEQAVEDDIRSGDGRTVSVNGSVSTLKDGLCYSYVDTHTTELTAEARQDDGSGKVRPIVMWGILLAYGALAGGVITTVDRAERRRLVKPTATHR